LDFWRCGGIYWILEKKVLFVLSTAKCSIFPLAGTSKVIDSLLSLSEVISMTKRNKNSTSPLSD
jgi:hypothetical protein